MTNKERFEDAEERAAIIQEGEKCQRTTAEHYTAKLRGFQTWQDMVEAWR